MMNPQDFALDFGFKGALRLNKTWNQNFVMSSILFCLPGMYLALTGLGAGGGQPTSQHLVSNTSAITFGVFALSGWLGGTVLNLIKPKFMIMMAATGYPLCIGSLWYFDRTGNDWFPYWAGVMLGLGAGMLWTAAGYMAYGYPTEDQKGRFISWQWALTSTGGTIGSIIAFAVNMRETGASAGVSDAVYTVFIVIQCCAILIAALFIVNPKHVTRPDGTHIAVFRPTRLADEMYKLNLLLLDWKVWLLIPGILVAEMNLTTISVINAYYFNLRTRSLNNVCLQLIMVPSPLILAAILDTRFIKSRRSRGFLGVTIMIVLALGTCSGTLGWILRNSIDRTPMGIDWTDSRYGVALFLMLMEGVVYGGYQIVIQWVLSALTNDPDTCARYSGLFKGTTGLGLCFSFIMDAQYVSFANQKIAQLVLYIVGALALYVIVATQVRETNYFLEDSVIVPHAFQEKLRAEGGVTEEQAAHELEKEEMAAQIDEEKAKGGNGVAVTTKAV